MFLITKILNLVVVLAIASPSVELVTGSDELDDDAGLKQALFLVELLKSDFAQILRTNSKNDINTTSAEDVNSTCALDDYNSTVAMNETEVTASGISSTTDVFAKPTTTPPTTPSTPPNPASVTPPGVPMMPFSSWPPLPMPGYPMPPGPGRQGNFPDENYRFPYRFNRRRVMPDYYYFDSPAKSPGQFRRLDSNNPPGDPGNTTATSQVQSTTNISPTTTAENTNTTTSLSTTIAQTNTSHLPPIDSTTLPTTTLSAITSEHSHLSSTEQSIAPTAGKLILLPAENSIIPTAEMSILPTAEKAISQPRTETYTQKVTETSTLLTKPRNRVGFKTRVPVFKARGVVIPNHNEKLINVSGHHLRHHKTTTEKNTVEDVEMAQIALELKKEFEGTKTENISNISNETKKDGILFTKKKQTSTMKIFLKGSSRLPVPLPENNAFCHFHPNNALCGTKL